MPEPKKNKPIGMILQEKGIINDSHIQFALKEQKVTKEKLGEILERLSFATEMDIASVLSSQGNIPYIDVDEILPDKRLLKIFNKRLCLNNNFLCYRIEEKFVYVVVDGLDNTRTAQLIIKHTGLNPKFRIGEKGKIVNAIKS